MSVDRELDQIRLLLSALTELVVHDLKVVFGMKPNRVDLGGDFDHCVSNGHMNVLDAFLGRDEYVLPILEPFSPRPECDEPDAKAAHSIRALGGLHHLPL